MRKNKGENNIINNIIKILILFIGIVLQVLALIFLFGTTSQLSSYYQIIFEILKFTSIIYIVYKNQNPAYKIIWIILMMFLPIAGFVAYILWGNNKTGEKIKLKIKNQTKKSIHILEKEIIVNEIKSEDRKKEVNFITNVTNYPLYYNDTINYFETGDKCYEKIIEDLKNAKKYILIEFFIISKGQMWNKIYEILKEKSKQKVKIYMIYDSLGCLLKKPKNFKKQLEEINIEYLSFNPPTPFIRSYVNYRNHRKIMVIDGMVAYTGGINIGDEYINLTNRLGHWKDCGIRITGEAVKNFITIFFKTWNLSKEEVKYEKMIKEIEDNKESKGYVLPFSDNPHNKKNPYENTYINVINNAKKYIYIMTPYLILDSETEKALINSSLSGVNIKIITPSIPDKKLVNACTKSFYNQLLDAGVQIYEYKPGFIHSKVLLSDDEVAVVGTTNFDFRSFYLNYECGIWMYNTKEEKIIKQDFEDTIKKCEEIKKQIWNQRKLDIKILEALLRLISPLL